MQLRHLSFSYYFIDPISCHMGFNQLNELPHFEFDVNCLSCHFGEWMTAGPTRSELGCLLSDGVRRCSLVLCNVLNCDQRCLLVHDTENLTFVAEYHAGDPQMAAQSFAYVCTDNYRFCAEQLTDSVWNSEDVVRSRIDVLCLFIFTEIARIVPS